jgi:hypothetical protein
MPRILSMVGLYVQWPHYIYSTLYPADRDIREKIEIIVTKIEANLYDLGITSAKANSAVVLFGLRAYHQRSDNQNEINVKSENTHSGEININLNLPKEKDE